MSTKYSRASYGSALNVYVNGAFSGYGCINGFMISFFDYKI